MTEIRGTEVGRFTKDLKETSVVLIPNEFFNDILELMDICVDGVKSERSASPRTKNHINILYTRLIEQLDNQMLKMATKYYEEQV